MPPLASIPFMGSIWMRQPYSCMQRPSKFCFIRLRRNAPLPRFLSSWWENFSCALSRCPTQNMNQLLLAFDLATQILAQMCISAYQNTQRARRKLWEIPLTSFKNDQQGLVGKFQDQMRSLNNHQAQSSILSVAPCLAFSGSTLPLSYLLASSSSCLILSCSFLMASRSLAMKRSTSSVHSSLALRLPLRIITSLASIQKTVAMDLGTLLLQGMTTSTYSRGASVLQRAMVGMLTQEASMTAWWSLLGSPTTRILGSWNFLVIWLVRVPGIHLEEALAVHPVYCPNLQTALCPCSLAQTTMTSARLGMEAMTLAANLILLQTSSTLKMQLPAELRPSTKGFMLWLIFSAPRWTLAARRRRISVVCLSEVIATKYINIQYLINPTTTNTYHQQVSGPSFNLMSNAFFRDFCMNRFPCHSQTSPSHTLKPIYCQLAQAQDSASLSLSRVRGTDAIQEGTISWVYYDCTLAEGALVLFFDPFVHAAEVEEVDAFDLGKFLTLVDAVEADGAVLIRHG